MLHLFQMNQQQPWVWETTHKNLFALQVAQLTHIIIAPSRAHCMHTGSIQSVVRCKRQICVWSTQELQVTTYGLNWAAAGERPPEEFHKLPAVQQGLTSGLTASRVTAATPNQRKSGGREKNHEICCETAICGSCHAKRCSQERDK